MNDDAKLSLLRNLLGPSQRSGHEHLFFCPFCNYSTQKLSINIEKNVWKCWVCDRKGRQLSFLFKKFGSIGQKHEWSAINSSVDISDSLYDALMGSMGEKPVSQAAVLPDEFRPLVTMQPSILEQQPMAYLRQRGILLCDIFCWKMGYCLDGQYAQRIVIPSFNVDGHLNFFIARSFVEHNPLRYLCPPVSKDLIFNEFWLDWSAPIVLVEGIFDAIVAGFNAVPLLGVSLSEQSRLLAKIVEHHCPIYVALDRDAKRYQTSLVQTLLLYGVEVYVIDIAPFADVGEMGKNRAEFAARKSCAQLITNDNFLFWKMYE